MSRNLDRFATVERTAGRTERRITMRFPKWLTFLPAFLFMVVCVQGQDVHYNYDRGANFAAYQPTNGSTFRAA